jgi:hypothetical protein
MKLLLAFVRCHPPFVFRSTWPRRPCHAGTQCLHSFGATHLLFFGLHGRDGDTKREPNACIRSVPPTFCFSAYTAKTPMPCGNPMLAFVRCCIRSVPPTFCFSAYMAETAIPSGNLMLAFVRCHPPFVLRSTWPRRRYQAGTQCLHSFGATHLLFFGLHRRDGHATREPNACIRSVPPTNGTVQVTQVYSFE